MYKIDKRKAYGALIKGDFVLHLRLLHLWDRRVGVQKGITEKR